MDRTNTKLSIWLLYLLPPCCFLWATTRSFSKQTTARHSGVHFMSVIWSFNHFIHSIDPPPIWSIWPVPRRCLALFEHFFDFGVLFIFFAFWARFEQSFVFWTTFGRLTSLGKVKRKIFWKYEWLLSWKCTKLLGTSCESQRTSFVFLEHVFVIFLVQSGQA